MSLVRKKDFYRICTVFFGTALEDLFRATALLLDPLAYSRPEIRFVTLNSAVEFERSKGSRLRSRIPNGASTPLLQYLEPQILWMEKGSKRRSHVRIIRRKTSICKCTPLPQFEIVLNADRNDVISVSLQRKAKIELFPANTGPMRWPEPRSVNYVVLLQALVECEYLSVLLKKLSKTTPKLLQICANRFVF